MSRVHVVDVNNGSRLVTYAIEGESGEICLNGAAARLVNKGDIVIILSYTNMMESELHDFHPTLVYVDAKNQITRQEERHRKNPFLKEARYGRTSQTRHNPMTSAT